MQPKFLILVHSLNILYRKIERNNNYYLLIKYQKTLEI